ncbi:Dihydrolipoamide acetyltransferase component of pyruvate dehydrogenase complex [Quillaja saponaria]|uniref:Dihydrolipoamide acetyltransferase component of pyruvate dehydrogenase complex n=1 Tax=Quillaja saponaria TaxID=32244 RepID=A0AAD7LBS7_QUISA|nr:Dihydrolipoamide acetyltransferase component of pyruvate dehydrogenase complex [Quillaja saponaria]
MLVSRIWQKKALSSGRRWLHPCISQNLTALLTSEQKASFLEFSSGSSFSTYSPASFCCDKARDLVNCNISYMKRYCFSSQAILDLPVGGIVDVPLAQTGEGIAECELLKWFAQEGDLIEEFQPLCEVQSDKATIEITSRYKGKVSQILHVPGDVIKVGDTLLKMIVDESQVPTSSPSDLGNAKPTCSELELELEKDKIGAVLATPAVRSLAKQHGINITDVLGTGKDGRILKEDIVKYAPQKESIKDPSDKTVPLRGFQRAMVKSMSLAAKVPHFHYVEEIECDSLVELKTSFQKNNPYPHVKHTFLPLLIKSLSMALSNYPFMNSCFNEDSLEVILKGSQNIGIAMATLHGLVVPNIKNVQSLSILEITKELARLQELASKNKLNPGDICGGTITLSNIGAIGGKFGSPLLNLPEVAIIAIGRIQKVARFVDDGNVYPASIMNVNIGADHRVLDGATVARFCNEWKRFIENPELLMLHMR